MQSKLPYLLTAFTSIFLLCQIATAQNSSPYWSLAGNSNASNTTSKLGTTNAINLRLFTNNVERIRILSSNGNVGIGTTTPTDRLHLNTPSGTNPFRAQVNGNTKLLVHSNGGVAVGGNLTPPANGLYVAGSVGVGTNTPQAPLDVVSSTTIRVINANSTYSGNSDRIGVYAFSVNAPGYGNGVQGIGGYIGIYGESRAGGSNGPSHGVYGFSSGTAGYGNRYGVFGNAYGGLSVYGVYGTASGGTSFNAAGYFNGAVWAGSYNTISDRKFKQDIQPVEHGLEQVLKLKPSVYTFKTGEYKGMHLPQGKQIGLVADEVKEVFPELVSQAIHPAEYDEKDRTKIITPEIKYEGVNYQGLIPVLIASIQEQQKQIEAKDNRIAALETGMAELRQMVLELKGVSTNIPTTTSAYLEQNTPNPVSGTTIIRYHSPDYTTSAVLNITNAKGQVVKTMRLSSRGSGQISLNTAALASGTYNYTLYVDGKLVDTKRLVIAR